MPKRRIPAVHLLPATRSAHQISPKTMLELHQLYCAAIEAQQRAKMAADAWTGRLTQLCADKGIEGDLSGVQVDFLVCELRIVATGQGKEDT